MRKCKLHRWDKWQAFSEADVARVCADCGEREVRDAVEVVIEQETRLEELAGELIDRTFGSVEISG